MWTLYLDAGLTLPATPLLLEQAAAGTPTDRLTYLGNPVAGKVLRNPANPGTDPLSLSVTAQPGPVTASVITMATTQAALDAATPGAPLTLPPTLTSGAANAQPVHIRLTSALDTPAYITSLSLTLTAEEVPA